MNSSDKVVEVIYTTRKQQSWVFPCTHLSLTTHFCRQTVIFVPTLGIAMDVSPVSTLNLTSVLKRVLADPVAVIRCATTPLTHRTSILNQVSPKFTRTHLHWLERGASFESKAPCPGTQLRTSHGQVRIRTSRSGVQRSNHQAATSRDVHLFMAPLEL